MASLQPAGDETGVIDVPLIEPRLTLFNLTVRGVRMEQLNGWPVVVIASPYAVFTTSPPMPDELGVADSNFPAMQEGATTHSYVWNSLYTRNKPRFPAGSTIAKLDEAAIGISRKFHPVKLLTTRNVRE
ncbi:hypothetical protein AJ80_00390 [Polytolypa hystricis UAMH7299]|uniref:Uncharacterized protein n=1 Tax=Polytolypa hystricis (strain UAMH7299) TaxID=1447883 RepID=A0A2B7Z357_POLH7|nr:hypothetical protein AJ80_00390 [Polytolypa hystricis UAMH7299]